MNSKSQKRARRLALKIIDLIIALILLFGKLMS